MWASAVPPRRPKPPCHRPAPDVIRVVPFTPTELQGLRYDRYMHPSSTGIEGEDDLSSRSSTILSLAMVAALAMCFVGVARAEDRAQAARALERNGATYGDFLDRAGHAIARVTPAGGTYNIQYSLPYAGLITGYRGHQTSWQGLAGKYAALLTGARAQRDWHSFFLRLRGVPVRGGDVQLTIDSGIQRTAAAALGKDLGAVVAMDPRSGAVLAMASNASGSGDSIVDRRFAPGSTFKIVTLTAALDTGQFHLDDVFSGEDIFGPSPYFDNSLYPSNITRSDLTALTLEQALAFSDNFTFAHIGLTLGAATLRKYAARYFIGRRIPFDLSVTPSILANGRVNPDPSTVALTSFGGDVDQVTPMQMCLIASAVANGGRLMRPYLVSALRSPSGQVEQVTSPQFLSRVMTRETARSITEAMKFVVNLGSGHRAQIKGVAVAGKTGTAASGGDKPNAWFIAFAPAYHPRIAVAVLRQFSGEGADYAAPIARKVILSALHVGAR